MYLYPLKQRTTSLLDSRIYTIFSNLMSSMKYPYRRFALIALFALIGRVQCMRHENPDTSYPVPTFTLEELQYGHQDELLRETLTTTGLLAIRVPTQNLKGQDQDLLKGLCRCGGKIGPDIHGGDQRVLQDGLTTRSTLATATMGTDRPLPLPHKEIGERCGMDLYHSMELARDYVSEAASRAFMPALDRMIRDAANGEKIELLTMKNGSSYTSVQSIVEDAVNLEHFHSYSKEEDKKNKPESEPKPIDEALDWHMDGGLFLAFLPAQPCNHNHNIDESFRVKIANAELAPLFQSGDNEIIVAIMIGAGAESWLQTPKSLRLQATRHAVKMSAGDRRAWYGMMHLVPADAVVQRVPRDVTFAELKRSSAPTAGRKFGDDESHPDDVIVGCGTDTSNNVVEKVDVRPSRRRLQHVGTFKNFCVECVLHVTLAMHF